MNITAFLNLLSNNLIPLMAFMLIAAILFKWITYRASKKDFYFMGLFTKELDKRLEIKEAMILKNSKDIEQFVFGLLDEVNEVLPDRGLRGSSAQVKPRVTGAPGVRGHKKQSLIDFTHGKQSLVNNLKSQIDVFKTSSKPHFADVTAKILRREQSWIKVAGFIPILPFSRLIDILPGLFIVGGIFGTFLGITAALPIIGNIDLNQMDKAAPLLASFVTKVSFSMQTSIFGIIFSVSLTLLNTIFPIKNVRADIFKRLDNSIESLWYRIHGQTIDSYQERLLGVLEKMCGKSEEMVKTLNTQTSHLEKLSHAKNSNDDYNQVA